MFSAVEYRIAASVFTLGIFEMVVEKADVEKSVICRREDGRYLSAFPYPAFHQGGRVRRRDHVGVY